MAKAFEIIPENDRLIFKFNQDAINAEYSFYDVFCTDKSNRERQSYRARNKEFETFFKDIEKGYNALIGFDVRDDNCIELSYMNGELSFDAIRTHTIKFKDGSEEEDRTDISIKLQIESSLVVAEVKKLQEAHIVSFMFKREKTTSKPGYQRNREEKKQLMAHMKNISILPGSRTSRALERLRKEKIHRKF